MIALGSGISDVLVEKKALVGTIFFDA